MKYKVGQVLEFHYDASDPVKHRFGKVTSVRDTQADPVLWKTLEQHPGPRSRYLIRCAMSDGTYRSFYHSFLTEVRKVGIIRRVLLYFAGERFGETAKPKVFEVGEVGRGRD